MTRAGACLLVLAAACAHGGGAAGPNAAPGAVAGDEAAVRAALDELADAAARADEPRYFALFASDAVFIGTDATERWDLAAYRAWAHPFFARGKAWTIRATSRHVVVEGDLAWFDEWLESVMGPARGSGVLRRTGDGWRIAQYVLSLSIPNKKARDVKALLERN